MQTSSASANQIDPTTLRQLQQLQQLLSRQPGGGSGGDEPIAGSSGGPSSASSALIMASNSGPVPHPALFAGKQMHDFDYGVGGGGSAGDHHNQKDDGPVLGHGISDVILDDASFDFRVFYSSKFCI